ncbi:MAG TPA: lipoyl(octanoyl) transferase LipB [Nitrospira sp.]|nr:lipoyl(octanoyl) transferase LipB [Nitrospira sp.]
MTAIEAAIAQAPVSDSTFIAQPPRSGVLVTFEEPVSYSSAWLLQQQFHGERLSGARADTLMLLQHLPVYTAGRRTRAAHFKPAVGLSDLSTVALETVNRGGSVTYHGPGQVVAYPILALSQYAYGAKAYVHMLEEVLIQTLLSWEIHGIRLPKRPGIWVRDPQGEMKIASIGARIDRGITLHGFALNVSNDLVPFSRIVPCGLEGCRMTSMAEIGRATCSVPLVAERLAKVFSNVFHIRWTERVSGSGMTLIERQPEMADRTER